MSWHSEHMNVSYLKPGRVLDHVQQDHLSIASLTTHRITHLPAMIIEHSLSVMSVKISWHSQPTCGPQRSSVLSVPRREPGAPSAVSSCRDFVLPPRLCVLAADALCTRKLNNGRGGLTVLAKASGWPFDYVAQEGDGEFSYIACPDLVSGPLGQAKPERPSSRLK